MKPSGSLTALLRWGMFLWLFLLPWQTIWITKEQFIHGGKWEYGTIGFYATELLFWLLAGSWLGWYIRAWRGRVRDTQAKFSWTPDRIFTLTCGLFVGYCFLSIFWSYNQLVAQQHATYIMEAAVLFFMLLLGPFTSSEIALSYIFGSIIQIFLAIAQFFTQTTWSTKLLGLSAHPVWTAGSSVIQGDQLGRWLRPYGAFPHPNMLGGYLVVALVLTDLMAEKKPAQKIFWLLLTLLQSIGIFFTFSRASWAAALLWIFGLFIFTKKSLPNGRSLFLVSRLASLFIISLIFFPLLQNRVAISAPAEISSVAARISGYKDAGQIFMRHPWHGIGMGNATAGLAALYPSRPFWEYQPAHNVFLLIFTELGIIGALILVLTIICAVRYFKVRKSPLFILGILCYVSISLFDHYPFSSYVGLMFSSVFFAASLRFSPTSPPPVHTPFDNLNLP